MPARPLVGLRVRTMARCALRVAFCLAASGGLNVASAQLPAARLSAIQPAGGQAGTSVEVTIAGADLEEVNRLHFSHPGITAAQKTQPVEGQEEPQPVANVFIVQTAEDTPVGMYELRAIGKYGITNPRAFAVGDRAEVAEVEPNNGLSQFTEVPLGCVINGRCDPARDVDCFRFPATAGQRVVIDLWAERIDSRLDGVLQLFDADGRQLALDRGTYGRDPFIEFTAPADGNYLVRVHDAQYGGGVDFVYRLSIGVTPHIDFVFPPAGMAGSKQTFTLYGRNLPGSEPAEGVSVSGRPLERLTVEIDLPAEADRLTSDSRVGPAGAFLDGMNYRLATPAGSSNPVVIGFATAPAIIEQEPNNLPAEAQKIAIPCEVAGQFAERGDVDCYEFTAQEGEAYRIEVLSARLGLSADPWFAVDQITVADGKEQVKELRAEDDIADNIGGLSFATASPDAGFRFVAPATSTYRVRLHDLYFETRGDPRLIYRLSIRQEQPDFRLVALAEFPNGGPQNPSPWTNLLRKGGTDMLTVLADRRDGFNGEIELAVAGLPEGVECAGGVLGPGQSRTVLVLTSSEEATDWAGTIRVVGTAQLGDQSVSREARPAAILHASANQPAPARLARDLALAVAQQAPLKVTASPAEVTLVQGYQLPVAIHAARRGELKGPINLTALGLPPNVQNDTVALAPEADDATVNLFVNNNTAPGRYMFYIQASATAPYTKNADGSDKKDVALVDASTPVQLTILPGPVVLEPQPPNKGIVKRGAALEIPVKLTRRNSFAGPVTLELALPAGVSGVAADPVVVAAEEAQAKLVINAGAEATEGDHARVFIRARVEQDGRPIEVQQPIPLNVQK